MFFWGVIIVLDIKFFFGSGMDLLMLKTTDLAELFIQVRYTNKYNINKIKKTVKAVPSTGWVLVWLLW